MGHRFGISTAMFCPTTILFGMLFFCITLLANGRSFTEPQEITIRTTSPLVLVDVIARDKKTGAAIDHLTRSDLKLTDNGKPVSIEAFDPSPRPITIWFVMICNQTNWFNQGSTFFAGKSDRLRPALEHLNTTDRVAVAHWCDNGGATMDLPPTSKPEAALAAIEDLLHRPTTIPVGTVSGVSALRQMMKLIAATTHNTKPRPTPVIVFIHGDAMGMRQPYAKQVIDDLFEMSGIVYGLNNGLYKGEWDLGTGQQRLAKYWSKESGGQLFSTKKEAYGEALEKIIDEAHARYQLGFVPQTLDGRWHRLRLELADHAKNKFKSASLRYRSGYNATAEGASSSGLDRLPADVIAPLDQAQLSATAPGVIRFEAEAKSRATELHSATIIVGFDSTSLTWSTLPDKKDQSYVTLAITFLSDDGQILSHQIRDFEIARPMDDWQNVAATLIPIFIPVDLPPRTKNVRLMVREMHSGRMGVKEVPRKIIGR